MKDKEKNWAYKLGYNIGVCGCVLGCLLGAGFYGLNLWYSLYVIHNPLSKIPLFWGSVLSLILFCIAFWYVSKNNLWIDEDEIKQEILSEIAEKKDLDL